ncbi:MAG: class I SAM-dependent methyltransferase [Defluviitaleaceae bacterium]|nr:class I SAM-dependent methyltransferase [Defluviitaleaceae bacterium]
MSIGWERERRGHFDSIVDGYDKVRPEYPAQIYTDIFKYAATGKNAIEIGAGTGKATHLFLDGGYSVTAIEIGGNMTEFLQERFQGNSRFNAITAAFEDADLAENSYDLIYAATAFHWVDAEIGCPKALQLLKKGGAIALFRYTAMPGDGDPIYEAIQDAYQKHYHQPAKRPQMFTKEDLTQPKWIYTSFRCKNLEEYGFKDVSMKFYDASRTFTAEEYIAMLDTFSDHISLPDNDRAALYTGIRDAIQSLGGGYYKVDYVFQLYMGRK